MTARPSEVERLLVTLLARERALFRPFREPDWPKRSARWEAQEAFRRHGLRWSAGGTGAERKAAERQLAEIVAAGLIKAHGTRGRKTHLTLTDRGRQVAAALCGAPDGEDARQAVLRLLDFAPAGRLVSELLPAGLDDYADDYQTPLFAFQQNILHAILAGWIETNSDCYGRAAYLVTAAGKAAAAAPADTRRPDLRADPALIELYDNEYAAECARLLALAPTDRNQIAPIPLSAGGIAQECVGPWTRGMKKRNA
jgi:hypothetical protein